MPTGGDIEINVDGFSSIRYARQKNEKYKVHTSVTLYSTCSIGTY